MEETRPAEPEKECQDFCEWAECVSEIDKWQCEVPELQMIVSGLSEFDRGFLFCESSFLEVMLEIN